MLRDEPATLYIYECIKIDKDDNIKTVKKIDGKTIIDPHYQIGDLFFSKTNDLNDKYYKLIGNYRQAFVGDMQERLDKYMHFSNMENYARTTSQPHHRIEYRDKIIYKRLTFWQSLRRWFYNNILLRENNNIDGLDEYLFGDKGYIHNTQYYQDWQKGDEQLISGPKIKYYYHKNQQNGKSI